MPLFLPHHAGAIALALPWILTPVVVAARAMGSRSLDGESDVVPADAPRLSVIVPARDEARNIARCVRSILDTRYAPVEVIVVDDHSSDDTARIARAAAEGDARFTLLEAPPLPDGWFGKQSACAAGANAARGALLLFTDADTRHAPDLYPRAINALRREHADLLTIAGTQEMESFWERVIQPQIFMMLAIRYGGTEPVNRATRAVDAIANGQFMLFTRDAYHALGGHASVRDQAAEDMMLAQRVVGSGGRLRMYTARSQFSTRMYTSLGELVAGWRKNIYAAGRHASLGGRIGRALYPALLLAAPSAVLLPPTALVLALIGILSTGWFVWSAISVGALLVLWLAIYGYMRAPLWYAFLFPLGAAMLGYIAMGAVVRGRRVRWKDREYRAA